MWDDSRPMLSSRRVASWRMISFSSVPESGRFDAISRLVGDIGGLLWLGSAVGATRLHELAVSLSLLLAEAFDSLGECDVEIGLGDQGIGQRGIVGQRAPSEASAERQGDPGG